MINKKKFFSQLPFIVPTLVVAALIGCGGTPAPTAVPNPAAEKCIKDGFELEPIVVNGVPQGYRCVDPITGESCEVWAYYRDQCELTPKEPSSDKKQ